MWFHGRYQKNVRSLKQKSEWRRIVKEAMKESSHLKKEAGKFRKASVPEL
jgi:hypothetical protein